MSPEFRTMIYKWEYDGDKNAAKKRLHHLSDSKVIRQFANIVYLNGGTGREIARATDARLCDHRWAYWIFPMGL